MDNKTASEWLESIKDYIHGGDEKFDMRRLEAIDAGIQALKAQEPANPLVVGRGESFETAEAWWYECGNCGGALTLDDKYCRKCGREVKWQ